MRRILAFLLGVGAGVTAAAPATTFTVTNRGQSATFLTKTFNRQ